MVGFEAASAVGAAMSIDYSDDLGWHPTGPLGAIGAGATAARLLGLDVDKTAMAISLAASQAAGLRQNFGTMTKPFHAGNSARSGVVAAMLVKKGLTASTDGLEGRYGFIHAFSGGQGYDKERVLEGLGKKHFALLKPGIEIKKYPCCGSTHLALDALFGLLRSEPIDPSQVEEVEVRVDFDPPRSLIHYQPRTALEGKFSMQYCIAAALLDGKVGLRTFTDEQVMRPEAQALIPRVRMVRNPGFQGQPSWVEGYTEVRIRLRDGRVLTRGVKRSTEGALRGVTEEELRNKFRDCASQALPDKAVERALSGLENLEGLESIVHLMDILRG
jgi:2-methylcitrate dehydratase PrpD